MYNRLLRKTLIAFLITLLLLQSCPTHLLAQNSYLVTEAMKRKELNARTCITSLPKIQIRTHSIKPPYSAMFHQLEFGGAGKFTNYPFTVTIIGDFFRLDYKGEFEIAKAKLYELHGVGMKVVLYMPFSSLSERKNFLEHWNLSIRDIAPMDLNGTYYVDLPYTIGYEGRSAWQEFFIEFLRFIFDAGFDGVEFDGGDGLMYYGSFDPETMQRFNQYLASKYSAAELKEKFNISDITTFNFTQYLRDLGYHHNSVAVGNTVIAHPGIDGPKGDKYAEALWEEFRQFNLMILIEFYRILMKNVKQWEEETGRDFYVSTRIGITPIDLPVLLDVDGVNWEYCWISGNQDYPNRTSSKDLWVLRCLNKTFNLWIYPWSSLGATGFTGWYSNGWNKTMDPEEQYLALSEVIVFGGQIPVTPQVEYGKGECINRTHFSQFVRLVQENPELFTNNTPFGEVGLVFSTATAINLDKLNLASSVQRGNDDGFEGTFYLLADSHIPFDVILFGDNIWTNATPSLSKLLKYKAIILPETLCLTDDQVNLLQQYVENGGVIIGIGDIAKYNEYGEPVNREFSTYFDGQVRSVGSGLIVSIKDISLRDYLIKRAKSTRHDSQTMSILERFRSIINNYVSRDIETDLSPRAHVYRFLDPDGTRLVFHIINYDYDFEKDKVIRAYNVKFNFTLPPQLQGKELSIWLYSEDYIDGIELPYEIIGDKVSITIPKVSILTSIEVRPHFDYKEPLTIDKYTVFDGETIYLDRDLIVNSELVIKDSSIIVRGNVKPIKIEVLPGASLYVINSRIMRDTGKYYIVARAGSRIFIENSEISGAGLFGPLDRGGLCIETRNAVILNSVIHDNYHFGILLYNGDCSIIGNNLIYNNDIGVAIVNSSYVDFFNNTVINNNVGICVESPDIYDAGARLRSLIKMWRDRKIPSRGAAKIVISQCRVLDNAYTNIIVIGSNFVTIKDSEIGITNGNNIFCWESSMIKIYNCTIYSGHNGIYLEECPVNTILNSRIYNHSFAGILIYKCTEQGVLHWNHLENLGADTRIVGNYIRNNTYGIYMDFGWGYTNYYMRIQKNEISFNHIGIYVNLTGCNIYENNFIGNDKHALAGPGGAGGLWESEVFYLNISQILYGFRDPPVGNYWDDWDKETIPYEVCPGYYDYYPLENPVEIPAITDANGPSIAIDSLEREWVNETHYRIEFNYTVVDESYLGSSGGKDQLRYFGFYHFLGPYLRQLDPPYLELEFPWLGYPGPLAGDLLGPEELTNIYHGSRKLSIVNAEWLRGAILTLYITDMWGNWNKNDSRAPSIAIIYLDTHGQPMNLSEGREIKVYCLVSDWSPLKNVTLLYSNGSNYVKVAMNYDLSTHLYYCVIPAQESGTVLRIRIYAEDIYGNSYITEENQYVIDSEPPTITGVYWDPQNPTEKDNVTVYANISDPIGVKIAILSYFNGTSWLNVTLTYNSATGLYEGTIPAQPANTKVRFKIYACDNAGNWAVSEEYSYVVTESKGRTNFLYILISVGVIAVLLVITITIVRKRRIKV